MISNQFVTVLQESESLQDRHSSVNDRSEPTAATIRTALNEMSASNDGETIVCHDFLVF
ncbi:hypothetical protein SAMN04487967_2645 [Natronorubrum sediminis]|uniref:Uncharacterized protein n=1 Tax=Natronorubrum sediminis TaxID=640943 RepID=A0A1H6G062_9EURY|nr:hypothetical protein SAMN04487967_2645 [Natronorubrum sediminis]